MKRSYVVSLTVLAVCFLFCPLLGQRLGVDGHGMRDRPGFKGAGGGFGFGHPGGFLMAPSRRAKFWSSGSFFHSRENSYRAMRYGLLPGFPVYYGWSNRARPKNYSSAYFVQQWKDRDPLAGSGDRVMDRSLLLSRGMSDAAVMGQLGSPIQRSRLGNRELWRYSPYSLLFESGVLTEIR